MSSAANSLEGRHIPYADEADEAADDGLHEEEAMPTRRTPCRVVFSGCDAGKERLLTFGFVAFYVGRLASDAPTEIVGDGAARQRGQHVGH